MGACATKPKVLKVDSGEAPEDAAAGVGAAAETKLEYAGDQMVDDDKKEGKDSNETEKAAADVSEKQETPPETEKQTNPLPEEKPSETNPPEPPPSDDVTDKTTIIPDAVETPSETKKENNPTNREPVEDNANENDPPTEIESSEKPIETEK